MSKAPDRKSHRGLRVALWTTAVLLAGVSLISAVRAGGFGGRPSFHGTAWEPPQTAADFHLTDHAGQPASLRDFRGETVLLFFGYVNCPDVCPLTLTKLDRVLSSLGADARGVRVLLISVDPDRDTPAALARYVARFGPRVTGLTGDADTLKSVLRSYYAFAEPSAPQSYPGAPEHAGHGGPSGALSHTPQVFGIDRQGEIRVLLPMDRSDDEIAGDIRTLTRF